VKSSKIRLGLGQGPDRHRATSAIHDPVDDNRTVHQFSDAELSAILR
jgi:hypothetical protein